MNNWPFSKSDLMLHMAWSFWQQGVLNGVADLIRQLNLSHLQLFIQRFTQLPAKLQTYLLSNNILSDCFLDTLSAHWHSCYYGIGMVCIRCNLIELLFLENNHEYPAWNPANIWHCNPHCFFFLQYSLFRQKSLRQFL